MTMCAWLNEFVCTAIMTYINHHQTEHIRSQKSMTSRIEHPTPRPSCLKIIMSVLGCSIYYIYIYDINIEQPVNLQKGMVVGTMLEIGLLVGAIALSATYFVVKCLAQVEQSRCVEVDCCCNAIRLRRAVEVRSTVVDVAQPMGGMFQHSGGGVSTTV
jgi:hypothetical protein